MVKKSGKKLVWHSLKGADCTVLAWSYTWVKITHPKFKGARVFHTGKKSGAFYSVSVPAADGTVQAFRVVGAVACYGPGFVLPRSSS